MEDEEGNLMGQNKETYTLLGFANFFNNIPDFLIPLFGRSDCENKFYFMNVNYKNINEFIEINIETLIDKIQIYNISKLDFHLEKTRLRNINIEDYDFSIGKEPPCAVQLNEDDIIYGYGIEFVSNLVFELEQLEFIDRIFALKVREFQLHYHSKGIDTIIRPQSKVSPKKSSSKELKSRRFPSRKLPSRRSKRNGVNSRRNTNDRVIKNREDYEKENKDEVKLKKLLK